MCAPGAPTPKGCTLFCYGPPYSLNAPSPLDAFSVLSIRYFGSDGRKSVSEMCFVGKASNGLMGPSASNQSVYLGNFQGQFTSILSPAGWLPNNKVSSRSEHYEQALIFACRIAMLVAALSPFTPSKGFADDFPTNGNGEYPVNVSFKQKNWASRECTVILPDGTEGKIGIEYIPTIEPYNAWDSHYKNVSGTWRVFYKSVIFRSSTLKSVIIR